MRHHEHNLTYGEACVLEKSSLYMERGVWKQAVTIENKPPPMSKKDAAKHYNTKLFAYWLGHIDNKYSLPEKKAILNYLMFRSSNKEKIFKNL